MSPNLLKVKCSKSEWMKCGSLPTPGLADANAEIVSMVEIETVTGETGSEVRADHAAPHNAEAVGMTIMITNFSTLHRVAKESSSKPPAAALCQEEYT